MSILCHDVILLPLADERSTSVHGFRVYDLAMCRFSQQDILINDLEVPVSHRVENVLPFMVIKSLPSLS